MEVFIERLPQSLPPGSSSTKKNTRAAFVFLVHTESNCSAQSSLLPWITLSADYEDSFSALSIERIEPLAYLDIDMEKPSVDAAHDGNRGGHFIEQDHPPHHGMSPAKYITSRFSSLKPPMTSVPNPITLLRMISVRQWSFFGVAFIAWVWCLQANTIASHCSS